MKPESQKQPAKKRILVVEDHPLVREGIVHLLDQQGDLEACGGIDAMGKVIATVVSTKPDLLLLDMRLTDGDALPHLPSLRKAFPTLRILVLSQFDETLYAERALRAGANGYIMKEQASQEVLSAIRAVLNGKTFLSRTLAIRLAKYFPDVETQRPQVVFDHLSERERNVLELLGVGRSTREIAYDLGLSVKTIETYRENLKAKLGLKGSAELVRYASEAISGRQIKSHP